jgi:hypothetical protein
MTAEELHQELRKEFFAKGCVRAAVRRMLKKHDEAIVAEAFALWLVKDRGWDAGDALAVATSSFLKGA